MAQRVDYAPIPNVVPGGYISTINKMLGHVKRNRLKMKEFRDWLREQNLWSKEDIPLVLSVIDVVTQPLVALGPFAEQLFAAEKEDDAKNLLYARLRSLNLILTKSVMDVLDTEKGGRLFSTHELYRMITSHLYEGAYIPLPSFQAWIGWMEAAGILRYIGIRWGLSDAGKAAMQYIRNLDMEELLEDERAEHEGEAEPDGAATEVAAAAATVEVDPVSAPAPAAPATELPRVLGPDEPYEEELPDEFPEAPPPSDEAAAAAMERLGLAPTEEPVAAHAPTKSPSARPTAPRAARVAPAAVPQTPVTPAVIVARPAATGLGAARIVAAPLDDAARQANAAAVRAWWQAYPTPRVLHADDLGLHPKDYDRDRPLFLVKLAMLGVLAAEAMDAGPVRSFFAALQEVRLLERVWKQHDSLEQALADVGFFQANAAHLEHSEALIHALAFMHRLRLNPGLVARWEGEADPTALVTSLFEDLFGGHFPLAPFWVVREMVLQKLWESEGLEAVAAVPTYRARENAYRLGFVDSLYAESFPAMVEASKAISRHFGRDAGFNAALENLPDQLGCSFHCGRVYVCTYHCREKLGR